MNILFLDDCPSRTKIFRSQCPSAICLETAKDCIICLSKQDWDLVFLDHDLGGEIYSDQKNTNTGSEVVRWIIQNRPKIKQVIVHSLNGPARIAMCYDLKNAGYNVLDYPFAWLKSESFINMMEDI
jgi:hypothetical protein